MKGVDRLKRNEKGFICEGFRLLGGKIFGPADYIVRGARRRKAGTGFYSHFGKRVEACSSEARGLDDGIIFFNGWPLVRNAGEAARQRRDRDTPSRAC